MLGLWMKRPRRYFTAEDENLILKDWYGGLLHVTVMYCYS